MTDIYVLTARDRASYSAKPTKLLRAFDTEAAANEVKAMIEECNPAMDVEVVAVPLATETAQKPAQAPAFKMPNILMDPAPFPQPTEFVPYIGAASNFPAPPPATAAE